MNTATKLKPTTGEKPILFSGPMVRAILAGRKSVTRRIAPVLLPADKNYIREAEDTADWCAKRAAQCPFGQPGDRLWVRETCAIETDLATGDQRVAYRADGDLPFGWTSPIHMPRWASRLTLEILSVRVERLQAITEADAVAEGVAVEQAGIERSFGEAIALAQFRILWDQINGKRAPWASNPWVWRVEFKQPEVPR